MCFLKLPLTVLLQLQVQRMTVLAVYAVIGLIVQSSGQVHPETVFLTDFPSAASVNVANGGDEDCMCCQLCSNIFHRLAKYSLPIKTSPFHSPHDAFNLASWSGVSVGIPSSFASEIMPSRNTAISAVVNSLLPLYTR